MENSHREAAQEVYTLQETAAILKVTTRTVRNWIKKGLIRASKLGRIWRIRREEIDRLLRRSEPEIQNDPPDTPYGECA